MAEVASLRRLVTDLREEVARLKGLNRRPPIKPSGMEIGDPAKPVNKRVRRWRGRVVPKVAVEDQVVKAEVRRTQTSRGTKTTWYRTWWCKRGSSGIGANASALFSQYTSGTTHT